MDMYVFNFFHGKKGRDKDSLQLIIFFQPISKSRQIASKQIPDRLVQIHMKNACHQSDNWPQSTTLQAVQSSQSNMQSKYIFDMELVLTFAIDYK